MTGSVSESALLEFVSAKLLGGAPLGLDDELLLSGRVDSLGVMTLVAHLEAETGQSIPHGDVLLEHFETPRAILSYLGSRI